MMNSVISGGAYTRQTISNVSRLYDIAEDSEGVVRERVLETVLAVTKELTRHVESNLETTRQVNNKKTGLAQ